MQNASAQNHNIAYLILKDKQEEPPGKYREIKSKTALIAINAGPCPALGKTPNETVKPVSTMDNIKVGLEKLPLILSYSENEVKIDNLTH